VSIRVGAIRTRRAPFARFVIPRGGRVGQWKGPLRARSTPTNAPATVLETVLIRKGVRAQCEELSVGRGPEF
jgi:hypothetical protein